MKTPPSSFFVNNRERAMERLKGGLLVVAGYKGMQKTNDEEFRFAQESNMWYLSGIEFPDWWLIIDAGRHKSWLVEPTIDERHRLFTESLAIEEAKSVSGINDILTRDEAMSMLRAAAKTHPLVYTVGHFTHHDYFDFALNPAIAEMKVMLDRTFVKVEDFRNELAKLRAIKQPVELEYMQAAIDLSAKGLSEVKKKLASYKFEYEIEAELSYIYRASGGSGHAFDPIVASGGNATVAHYFTNNAPLKKGTLVMVDVGAKLHGYVGDITRTYEYGKPAARMVAVHDAVRKAQHEIMNILAPGLLIEDYYRHVDKTIKQAMIDLKLISSMDDEGGYRRFMPYSVSHGLGVDLHDALGKPRMFEPGMVLTVEPGIHIASEKIGVRIEDDVLITESGHRNMSAKLSVDL